MNVSKKYYIGYASSSYDLQNILQIALGEEYYFQLHDRLLMTTM